MKDISRLHYITQDNILGYTHVQLAEEACLAGADWVQLRVKKKGYKEWLEIAEQTLKVCRKYNAKLIINDNVRITKEIGADGVHLGKTDSDPLLAREILGNDIIIGGTANTFVDIELLAQKKVDYIGLGPFRFTSTKDNLSPVLGIDGYIQIMNACKEMQIDIPVIAIGGIVTEDISSILSTGIYGVAVASAINESIEKEKSFKAFKAEIKKAVTKNETINNSR